MAAATFNSLTQLAQMYNLLESVLRKAATYPSLCGLTIQEINSIKNVQTLAKNKFQVRDLLKSLVRKGHVTQTTKPTSTHYEWDLSSPSFILKRKAKTVSSEVTCIKPEIPPNATLASMVKVAKEVEIAMGGLVVLVGRNPLTGRVRITIDEA